MFSGEASLDAQAGLTAALVYDDDLNLFQVLNIFSFSFILHCSKMNGNQWLVGMQETKTDGMLWWFVVGLLLCLYSDEFLLTLIQDIHH